MESGKGKLIFEAIKADNVDAFSNLVQSNSDFKIKFGRFPLLSVCYLFNCTKILRKFETAMVSYGIFSDEEEIFEIYDKFKRVAGRALRLYADEESVVYPAEMLAILGQSSRLVKFYRELFKNEEIVKNIKKIYNLNQYSDVEVSTAKITLPREKLSLKQQIIAGCMAFVFLIFVAFPLGMILSFSSRFGLGISTSPIILRSQEELTLALSGGKSYYRLANDIVVTGKTELGKDFSGTLDGDGHTVTFENLETCMTDNLSGEIKNLKININNLNVNLTSNYGIISKNLSGKIDNCEVTGEVNVNFNLLNATDVEQITDTFFAAFSASSTGTISNCVSNVKVVATNGSDNNAYACAFVGHNSGEISGCKNLAEISANTVDVAGIAAQNCGRISGCKNEGKLSQTSGKQWHPNVAGIVIENSGELLECENFGDVEAVSETAALEASGSGDISTLQVYCGGIAATNISVLSSCKNFGNVSASSKIATVYAAGIACINTYSDQISGKIENSVAVCDITTNKSVDENLSYAAGVANFNATTIIGCGFKGNISAEHSGGGTSGMVAGICSFNYMGEVRDCFSDAKLSTNLEIKALFAVFVWDFANMDANLFASGNRYIKYGDDYSAMMVVRQIAQSLYRGCEDSECGCTRVESLSEFEEVQG